MAVVVSSHLHVVCFHPSGLSRKILDIADPGGVGGGGLGIFWVVCAVRDSKLAPRSLKNFP